MKPIYHPDLLEHRICYTPGKGWTFQTHTQAKGTREMDCWTNQSPFKRTADEAYTIMTGRFPVKRKAVANA